MREKKAPPKAASRVPPGGSAPPRSLPQTNDKHDGSSESVRILVVDDHPLIRRGLMGVLADEFPGVILGEAGDAEEALDQIAKHRWNVVVLDVSLSGRSGLDVLKEVKQSQPALPVLVLSVHAEDQFAIRVLQGGAAGYLTKQTAATELVAAVKRVLGGGKYIRPSVAEKLAEHFTTSSDEPPHCALSDREYQVFCLLAVGKTVKEIGAELSLSIKSISTYRSRILEKTRLKNNGEIMRYGLQHGLVDLPQAPLA